MSKSGRVRLSELRRAYRLLHECRDLGHAPALWPVHALDGLAQLTGGCVGIMAEIGLGRPAPARGDRLLGERGWAGEKERAVWYNRFIIEEDWHRTCLTFVRFLARPRRFETCCREQLVGDAEWYASLEFNEVHRGAGIDDSIWSFRRLDDPPRLFGFSMARAVGASRFGARERRLIHLFHDELFRHVGTSLVVEPDRLFADLPPRLRQTLLCLLEGDAEKQVALRLGLSRHTVHEYVGALYRRFGVQSRAELLALCLRLAPPPGSGTPARSASER